LALRFAQATELFLLKYRPGAWYSEFVFLGYKVAMACISILLGSSAVISLLLMGMCTLGLLIFVVHVKPFRPTS
jgi:hypothetical protein